MTLQFKPMVDPMPGMKAWGGNAGYFQFIITFEDGRNLASRDHAEWQGYTATFRAAFAKQTTRIGGVFHTFADAEFACRQMLVKLRQEMGG